MFSELFVFVHDYGVSLGAVSIFMRICRDRSNPINPKIIFSRELKSAALDEWIDKTSQAAVRVQPYVSLLGDHRQFFNGVVEAI